MEEHNLPYRVIAFAFASVVYMFKSMGIDVDTLDASQMQQWIENRNELIKQVDTGWSITIHIVEAVCVGFTASILAPFGKHIGEKFLKFFKKKGIVK
jgi:hypothetical protein